MTCYHGEEHRAPTESRRSTLDQRCCDGCYVLVAEGKLTNSLFLLDGLIKSLIFAEHF